jgi:hypothetical protein
LKNFVEIRYEAFPSVSRVKKSGPILDLGVATSIEAFLYRAAFSTSACNRSALTRRFVALPHASDGEALFGWCGQVGQLATTKTAQPAVQSNVGTQSIKERE